MNERTLKNVFQDEIFFVNPLAYFYVLYVAIIQRKKPTVLQISLGTNNYLVRGRV